MGPFLDNGKPHRPAVEVPSRDRLVLFKDLDRLPKMRRCVILPAAPTHAEIRQRCLEIQAGWDEATRRKRRVVSERVLEILHCHYLGDEGDCYVEDME